MAWMVNADGTREQLQAGSPLEMFDRDPMMARRVFEFQRAMRLAPMLQQAALRQMYARQGDVDEGNPVIQPLLELQGMAQKHGLDPFRHDNVDRALSAGIDEETQQRWAPHPVQRQAEAASRGPQPAFRRNAAGVLSPGAGNYGVFSAMMQQLGLPGSGLIPGKGFVTVQDAVTAAQRLGQGGGEIPDVPIPEIQALRQRRFAETAKRAEQARQAAAQDEERRRSVQAAEEHQRRLEVEQAKAGYARSRKGEEQATKAWEHDNATAQRDQVYYDRLRAALASSIPSYTVGQGVTLDADDIRAEVNRLERQYGGRPAPLTWPKWRERAVQAGDPRLADGSQQPSQGGGILGAIMGAMGLAPGGGRQGRQGQQGPPQRDGQLNSDEQATVSRLRSIPAQEQKKFLTLLRQRNPEAAIRMARALGFEVKPNG